MIRRKKHRRLLWHKRARRTRGSARSVAAWTMKLCGDHDLETKRILDFTIPQVRAAYDALAKRLSSEAVFVLPESAEVKFV